MPLHNSEVLLVNSNVEKGDKIEAFASSAKVCIHVAERHTFFQLSLVLRYIFLIHFSYATLRSILKDAIFHWK